jgi:2-polyprenyl-6-methoxyphenol hydroxylase-like FAD-dependent oxidoreductase
MRIAIIGAGIGGLTAALALRQFGFEPQVFEQAPALLDVGAAILMWPNAMRVLHQLGLADAVRQHGGIMEKARWLNYDGRLLNNFRFPKTDLPPMALHRAELQRVLLNALSENSIHLHHVFESYEQRAGEIVARFADGRSFECEALIGADGLHSRVRAQLLNDGPPTEHAYVAWRGVVDSPAPSITPGVAYEIYGRGQRFGIGTLGSGKIGWWASINKTLSEPSTSKKANEHEGHELDRDELLRWLVGPGDGIDSRHSDKCINSEYHLRSTAGQKMGRRPSDAAWRRDSPAHSKPGPGRVFGDRRRRRPGSLC